MNADLKDAFSRIKPVCDVLMVGPTEESIEAFLERIAELKKEVIQELQQYLLFPLITHMKGREGERNYEIQTKVLDCMRSVLERVAINSFEMSMKIEIGLLQIVFDHTKPGMIAEVPEELKLSVMNCLTVLQLNVELKHRETMLKTQVPLLGKAVYVCVHIAKLEKLRALRLSAINSVMAHTATHPTMTTEYRIVDPVREKQVVDMLSLILPGVLGALQDVATCKNNPGHVLVVTAINAMHRILCLAMNNKFMSPTADVTVEDFANMYKQKENKEKEVSSKDIDPKTLPVRSPQWFKIAGEKLLLITKSVVSLRTHEHFKVRQELAIYCSRLLFECNIALITSVPLALDSLILLARDDYAEVSEYCSSAINTYFEHATEDAKMKTLDSLCESFFATINSLPRVMNNIDTERKAASLSLVQGYIWVLRGTGRLASLLGARDSVQALCVALAQCVALQPALSALSLHAATDVTSPPPTDSPWCKPRHLDSWECERRMHEVLRQLGESDCCMLLLDKLLELFENDHSCEIVYVCNWMAVAQYTSEDFVKRLLNVYIEEDVWYLPLEVISTEPVLTDDETLDVTVYNPRAWEKDSVPDLYEGATETRYTDISYRVPRPTPPASRGLHVCATPADAHRNMLLSCLLTEGVGVIANRLKDKFQPFLLKTLCLVLERIGSKYEMLRLAGLKTIHCIAQAGGHSSVADLIKCNADYFTNQVTVRLKKAWNCQSALQILAVVMEYSDASILNYLYGIVQDVLVQSCDKYYEKDLYAYLQVFLTFVECIRKWYNITDAPPKTFTTNTHIDIMSDVTVFVESKETAERLLNQQEFEKESGKSVEEMYREDVKKKEEDLLDYDDTVTEEKPPPPQYVAVIVAILKRCLNYVSSTQRDNCILALQVLNRGLPALRHQPDELLPLVHRTWGPLASRLGPGSPRRGPRGPRPGINGRDGPDAPVMRHAFDLLVTMADLAKDFIRSRAIKDALPHIYSFLQHSSHDSYLKDVGSAYRSSPAFSLQISALTALPRLATDLMLEDEALEDVMNCVQPYLSKRQPKALQASAVEFFKIILQYDYGAAWYHLRGMCDNEEVLQPPANSVKLEPVVGTPYVATNKDYQRNINLIFNANNMVS
nr:TELO2-interacting protein 1 homolog isoform X1 [Helicoverpa armigera]XP_049693237.1 TELO2-interacting protein 1 homolog isoform X3 [Helicoverpa armigera]XP_049693238.1 TELO2-interacting protein 1 homolog isoform X4 [Helicoverpa armigera]XP_049693239.1 TELO2-interacting protein 1 homolog isoform X5 [Helicoverpa armigera]XP_049693240.1 TELO2-interacting protein 1 homolog isoform X6 [Helicoverpa armigera]XP_049693241.1 TELO2-interacting protein 1 homolog isoform X7 [Helicoverpa armigera]XP_04